MKKAQIIISAIMYFLCCQIILNSAGIRLIEVFQNFDIFSIMAISVIFVPLLISVVLSFSKGKENGKKILVLILSLFSVGLICINSKFTNLRGLNKSVTIVSNWRSGMPKEIKYYEYSNEENLVTISYHENGSMSKRVNYQNGVKSGNEVTFNQNSTTKNIKNYVNGELVVEYDYEDLDVKLSEGLPAIFKAVDNNDLSGIDKQLSQIAKSISPCCPQNYILNQYFENGKPKTKEKYINNKLNGESIEYYKNGKIKERGNKNAFGKIGKWEYFKENGKLSEVEVYDETGILIEKKKN